MNVVVITLCAVVFARVFFNFALTINGSWDDLNMISLFLMPGLAIMSVILSMLNVTRYKGHGGFVLASVGVLAFAVALMLYVTLTLAFAQIA